MSYGEVVIEPLTPAQWPAVVDLFGEAGAKSGCWCMYWHIGSEYRKRTSNRNKTAFNEIIDQGPLQACSPSMVRPPLAGAR